MKYPQRIISKYVGPMRNIEVIGCRSRPARYLRSHCAGHQADLATVADALRAGSRHHVVRVAEVLVAVPGDRWKFLTGWLPDEVASLPAPIWPGRWRKELLG